MASFIIPRGMDWDDFVKRGEERRSKRRNYPARPDKGTVIIAFLLIIVIALWIIWGVHS